MVSVVKERLEHEHKEDNLAIPAHGEEYVYFSKHIRRLEAPIYARVVIHVHVHVDQTVNL